MIKNYFKIAWRNLMKSKGYSAINIGGLAVGMAIALMIGLWVHDELSFNKYHRNYARIAQVMQHANYNGKIASQVSNPAVMSPELKAKFGSDFKYVVQTSWEGTHLLSVGTKHIKSGGIFMEPDGPAMLSLKLLKGSAAGMKDPYSILLSSSVATSIFGTQDPVNKLIKLNRKHDLKVIGVYEDLPENTSFRALKIIMPWELWLIDNPWVKNMDDPWDSNFSQTFVQLADNADMEAVSRKIKNIKLDQVQEYARKYEWAVFLHPMSKWNLYNEFKNGLNTGGNIQYVWMFSIIGIFVLLLACINFMNLSTARSEKRSKEVGIRKTVGSLRWQLIVQFFSESYLIVLLAFIISFVIVQLCLPIFNEVAGKKMSIPWESGLFWLFNILFILVTGV
ncbi:ABC transporter permease, partial [Flavihumibacter sp. CACIAM 22H1]|uniref:ABC transporter permease n=1 Tax=Flavihumibacter sp. CACIAM 22H1 TaxID=1812911 RepID=UPI0025BB7454